MVSQTLFVHKLQMYLYNLFVDSDFAIGVAPGGSGADRETCKILSVRYSHKTSLEFPGARVQPEAAGSAGRAARRRGYFGPPVLVSLS